MTAPEGPDPSASQPSAGLLGVLRAELASHPPFDRMAPAALDWFVRSARELYFAPGETVLDPAAGPVQHLYWVHRGAVRAGQGQADGSGGAFLHEAGDLFDVEAAMTASAAADRHESADDTFLFALPLAAMRQLADLSPPFDEFLRNRFLQFTQRSLRELQVGYASDLLSQQSLETPLSRVARAEAVTCRPDAPLRAALQEMHDRRIGSILVADTEHRLLGILTRHDVLDRVALAGRSLETPVGDVMSTPVHALGQDCSAQDAVLLMARHGIRHVPVTGPRGELAIVSERDLFGMQRMSARHLGAEVRAAADLPALQRAAQRIRDLARGLLGQGVSARHTTALISQLNDALTVRVLSLQAARHGVDLRRACWLALGSEGRAEQTIVTDQDNALLLADGASAEDRSAATAFARDANRDLDACGYPLCKGGIMAGEPGGCRSLGEWRDEFSRWMAHGSPEDLLNAAIYFDFRPLAGYREAAVRLREEVLGAAAQTPRFQKQLALNALERCVPLDWRGAIETNAEGVVDLKLRGAAIFVDAARLYALGCGVAATGTHERLDAIGSALGIPAAESQAWASAFEFLQTLRLRIQLDPQAFGGAANQVRPDRLNDLDLRTLRESFRLARSLQRRVALDYGR